MRKRVPYLYAIYLPSVCGRQKIYIFTLPHFLAVYHLLQLKLQAMHLVLKRPFAAAWLLAVSLTARPALGQWVVYGQYPSEDMQRYYQVNAKCMSAL